MEAQKTSDIEGDVTPVEEIDLFPGHQQWIKALESNQYKQCYGMYSKQVGTDKRSYCAMGVYVAMNRVGTYIPGVVPRDVPFRLRVKIANLNDSRRFSFPQIANWLKNPLNIAATMRPGAPTSSEG